MRFQGALVREQGITFGIAVVKPNALHSSERDKLCQQFGEMLGAPTVIMAQDSRGTPTFYGRPDIVRFLSTVSMSRIPWREYTV